MTAKNGVSQDELRDEVAAALPDGLEAVTGDDAADESASDLLEAVGFLSTFLLIFAGVSVVVAAFLIVNTFSILVAQRSRELALLRALGASARQVTRSVLLEALVIGLIGATLGVGLGVVLAMGIRSLFANFGLDLTGQPLIFASRTVRGLLRRRACSSRWPPPGCPRAGPRGSRPCRPCATTSRCPRPPSGGGWCSASLGIVLGAAAIGSGSSAACPAAARSSAPGCSRSCSA